MKQIQPLSTAHISPHTGIFGGVAWKVLPPWVCRLCGFTCTFTTYCSLIFSFQSILPPLPLPNILKILVHTHVCGHAAFHTPSMWVNITSLQTRRFYTVCGALTQLVPRVSISIGMPHTWFQCIYTECGCHDISVRHYSSQCSYKDLRRESSSACFLFWYLAA